MPLNSKQRIVFIIVSVILVLGIPTVIFATNNNFFSKNKTDSANPSKYEDISVTGKVTDGTIVLSWNQINDTRLKGYKIVASKNNPTPKYPDDGYLYFITDRTTTEYIIKGDELYNDGDIEGTFVSGELYYFSVTAIYENDVTSLGNSIALTFPKSATTEASKKLSSTLSGSTNGQKILLNWTKATSTNFSGYKVVVSKNNEKPSYPQDGYLLFIQDINKTSAIIDDTMSYNNGDFGAKLEPGQSYHFSITSLYGDSTFASNSISLTLPKKTEVTETKVDTKPEEVKQAETKPVETKPVKTPEPKKQSIYIVPKVKGIVEGSKIKISWNKIDTSNFVGYKVVASKNNANPVYPSSGYFFWITDKNTTEAYVDTNTSYNGEGDVGSNLSGGQAYYFSVTAIYDNDDWKKIAGNAVRLTVPTIEVPETDTTSYTKTTSVLTSATVENNILNVTWTKINVTGFQFYKVVIAENKVVPVYPQDGYYEYFTDINTTNWSTEISREYNGGDFGGHLKSGHTYNISITSVFGDAKNPSNVLKITIP